MLSLGVYYWVHKPVTPAQAPALAAALADGGVAALLDSPRRRVGAAAHPGLEVTSPGERVAVHAVLGWGVMGLAMLALGWRACTIRL